MNKRLIFWIKVVLSLVIGVIVAGELYKSWQKVAVKHIAIDWRWGPLAVAGFSLSMLTSASVWRWLAGRMGARGPTLPLLASYTYSQMGKYIPGKVVLLLMRIERSGRFGMTPAVCTLSTLLENALYMISGGLTGMLAIVRIASVNDPDFARFRPLLWPVTIAAVAVLIAACAPPIFYGLVNRLLRKMKQPDVAREQRLSALTLAIGVIGFVPCWAFGGLALWASLQCVHPAGAAPLGLLDSWWLAGAFALSVIIGMASLLPGGAGIREAALGAAAAFQFSALGVNQPQAILLGTAVAILQRIFQLIVEVLLGLAGMALSRKRPPAPTLNLQNN